ILAHDSKEREIILDDQYKIYQPFSKTIAARRQRNSCVRELSLALTAFTRIRVSRHTVYEILSHAGLHARRQDVCILFTPLDKCDSLNWSLQQRINVLFGDESRFTLNTGFCCTAI
ncbi:hypothetical protein TNIN_403431, partial [Trichonephila inaurata madagascariensis]